MLQKILSRAVPALLFLLAASCARPNLTEEGRKAAWVERTIAGMSLEEMVSQMFVVDVSDVSQAYDPQTFERILTRTSAFKAGGIVLFRSDPLQQAALVHDLQQQSKIPLFVAQDMEWGAAMRVDYATEFPKAMAIAATGDPENAFKMGRITAIEARAVGVNFVLAPVADVNSTYDNPVIGTRSFGDDPESVGRFVARFIDGIQSNGVIATAKHFPGHGSTTEDSHQITPVIARSQIQSDSLDLLPFRTAIQTGVGAIMTAHLAVADSSDRRLVPATLSKPLITDLLRENLGFGGLIISDALNMQGVGKLGVDSLVISVVDAGVDLLLMPPEPNEARRAILEAVHEGALSESRIAASVRRILRAKADFSLTRTPDTDLESIRSILTDPDHRAVAADIARQSVVALKNDEAFPIAGLGARLLLISLVENGDEESAANFETELNNLLQNNAVTRSVSVSNWNTQYPDIASQAREYDIVILADLTSETRVRRSFFSNVLRQLLTVSDRLIFAGMGSPYNLSAVPEAVDAVLLSFGSSVPSYRAVAEVITGFSSACGSLPVTLTSEHQRGAGLCIRQAMPRRSLPQEAGMDAGAMSRIDSLLNDAIADSAFPGAAIAVGHNDLIPYMKGFGHFTYANTHPVDTESRFDLASLTKVIATTTAIMLLYDSDLLALDDPVAQYIPEFGTRGKSNVRIRDLLTHTSGLIPFRRFYERADATRDTVLFAIYSDSLIFEPGSESRYSDFGPIVLAELVQRITGESFDVYAQNHIFEPLGMKMTGFRPASSMSDTTIVPTEVDDYYRHRLIQGAVHDENAYLLGGTAGHAGLFSNVEDLARFAHMIIQDGRVGDTVFIRPSTIRLFTTAVDKDYSYTRALGWDTKSPSGYSAAGRFFGSRSFGHTGFTGTSIWFDPDQSLYVILLTNRVYPSRSNSKHVPIRPKVADTAYEAFRLGARTRMGSPGD